MRFVKVLGMICVMGVYTMAMAAQPPAGGAPQGGAPQGGGKNPLQEKLAAFVEKDKADPPAKSAVEFTGSSMMEGWTDVTAHMAPMPAFNRAVGGSKTADLLAHVDALILAYAPKVVVLYSGINDVSEGVSVKTATENLQKIMEEIHAKLPETRVIYLAALNTSNNAGSAALIKELNDGVRKLLEKDALAAYLDVSIALVDDKGDTRPEFLTEDKTHYNSDAYEAMAKVVKPALEKVWGKGGRE